MGTLSTVQPLSIVQATISKTRSTCFSFPTLACCFRVIVDAEELENSSYCQFQADATCAAWFHPFLNLLVGRSMFHVRNSCEATSNFSIRDLSSPGLQYAGTAGKKTLQTFRATLFEATACLPKFCCLADGPCSGSQQCVELQTGDWHKKNSLNHWVQGQMRTTLDFLRTHRGSSVSSPWPQEEVASWGPAMHWRPDSHTSYDNLRISSKRGQLHEPRPTSTELAPSDRRNRNEFEF